MEPWDDRAKGLLELDCLSVMLSSAPIRWSDLQKEEPSNNCSQSADDLDKRTPEYREEILLGPTPGQLVCPEVVMKAKFQNTGRNCLGRES